MIAEQLWVNWKKNGLYLSDMSSKDWFKFADELSEINCREQRDLDAKNCSKIFEIIIK